MPGHTLRPIAALWLVLAATGAALGEPAVGSKDDEGRTFLFREPIEIYWNDWTARWLRGDGTGQVEVYIWGEGKTVELGAVLSINCESASGYFWAHGSLGHQPATERDFNENVPIEVVANAKRLFC